MGMSASQARFLALTARKSNVEFEGQQINQQRTTLSNESSTYYSELCNMSVPTPPSVDDYTTVSYTFDDGALTNTITSMIAKSNGYYSVSYVEQWEDDYSIVSASTSIIGASEDDDGNMVYSIGSTALRTLGSYTDEELESDSYLSTLDEDELEDLMAMEEYYIAMLSEALGYSGDWYVRYVQDSSTGSYVPYFYKATDVENEDNYSNGYTTSNINCYTLGTSTQTKQVLNALAKVEQDSSGRYISLTLYEVDEDGNIETDEDGNYLYTTYSLTTNTATDEDAYNDALNQYEYEQYEYDQKIQEINAKIEIVQQQDQNLELELKQLDTEESAISTELEAVQKVISKNIDSSFKTFNA